MRQTAQTAAAAAMLCMTMAGSAQEPHGDPAGETQARDACIHAVLASQVGRTCYLTRITATQGEGTQCKVNAQCEDFDRVLSRSTVTAGLGETGYVNCDGKIALKCEPKRVVTEEKLDALDARDEVCRTEYARSRAAQACVTGSVEANHYREPWCNVKARCDGPRGRAGGWEIALASHHVAKLRSCDGLLTTDPCAE